MSDAQERYAAAMEDLGFAADHLEPQGYACTPGFVKSNPANNPWYLEMCCEVYPEWAEILVQADNDLEKIVPGYNISQIKAKFGFLRFYVDLPVDLSPEAHDAAMEITYAAERDAPSL